MTARLGDPGWVKIGAQLFAAGGPQLVKTLQARGPRVFLDLKWHDIPHQVSGAVGVAVALGVDLVTVHALGGEAMMRAAAEAAGGRLRVVAVTLLTSHDAADVRRLMGRAEPVVVTDEVVRLACLAHESGLDGVVASPHETGAVRAALGEDAWIVVPGIRPAGVDPGDQRRTAEAATAVAAGATHLVVGRPITCADDPAAVYQNMCKAAE